MKWLEDFVSPSRDELPKWNADQAKRVDAVNAEVYKRNRIIVAKAKAILMAGAPNVPGLRDLEPPAIQIEYSRKFRELEEKERAALDRAMED